MKLNRTTPFVSGLVAVVFLAGMGDLEALEAQDGDQQRASSGRARVLVATFQTQGRVDDGFGEEIAEKVRDRVTDFDLLTAVSDDEVEDALDRFGLESTSMDLISWRQLASRLNAQLIVYGEVSRGGSSGNRVSALFVESSRGDTTQVPEFSVSGDGGDSAEEAAQQISQTLGEHVEFLRARLNCQDYLSSDQFADAKRNCDQALEVRPNNGQALYLRGQIAVQEENWKEAIDYLERAVEQSPSDEQNIQTLAYAHAQAGNTDRSLELYRQYLEFNPGDQDVRLSVAYNLANAGAYAEAMDIIEEGLKRDSTSANLWKYLGDVAIRKGTAGDQEEVSGSSITDTAAIRTSIRAYRKYTSLQPDSVDASLYRNMIGAHLQLGNSQEATQLSREALQQLPDDPGLWSLRADVLAKQEDLAGAVSAMDSVVALDTAYNNAYFKRGVFRLRSGEMESATSDFRTAIQEQGTDPGTVAQQLFATGHTNYFQRGQFQEAVSMFQAALEFAEEGDLQRQLHFWAGYGNFKLGEAIDQENQQAEACEPARQALDYFEEVLPHIEQAGDYQAGSQQQITQAVDVYIYRQEQIVKKSC